MPKVFICYRREDSIETAGRMYSWLGMRLPKDDVFMDVNAIAPGANFRRVIEMVISRQAEIMLVIIGKSWLRSPDAQGSVHERLREPDDHVRREIELALNLEKAMIPVLVQGATMPRKDELPDSIAVLADINALPVRPEPDFDNDMRRLRQAIVDAGASLKFHPPVVTSTPAPGDVILSDSPFPAPQYPRAPASPEPGHVNTPAPPATLWSRLFSRLRRG